MPPWRRCVYKGTADIQQSAEDRQNKVGDTWNVIAGYGDTPPGTNWAWSGLAWDPLGGTIGTRAFFQTLVINGTTLPVADGTLRFVAGTAKRARSRSTASTCLSTVLPLRPTLRPISSWAHHGAGADTRLSTFSPPPHPQLTPDGTLQYNIQVGACYGLV